MDLPIEINRQKCPPQVDCLIPEINRVILSNNSHFYAESLRIQEKYGGKISCFSYQPMGFWVRDQIASKTDYAVYITNEEILDRGMSTNYSQDLIKNNNRISPRIEMHFPRHEYEFPSSISGAKPTGMLLEGGNTFHAFIPLGESLTAEGKYCVVIGEAGLCPQLSISHDFLPSAKNAQVGKNAVFRYPANSENAAFAKHRQEGKQIIREQLGDDTPMIIVPNAYSIHIDMEMAILPNGTVLLQSFTETLKFMQTHKEFLSTICDWDKTYAHILDLCKTAQPLLDITEAKLKKAGFKVKPVCGFIPGFTSTNQHETLLAFGFNGLTMLNNGEIIYALANNFTVFYNYFSQQLKDAGVSVVHQCELGVEFVNANGGFFRCQTNVLPKAMLNQLENPENKQPESILSSEEKTIRDDFLDKVNFLLCSAPSPGFFKNTSLQNADVQNCVNKIKQHVEAGEILMTFMVMQMEYNIAQQKCSNRPDIFSQRLGILSRDLAVSYPAAHSLAKTLCDSLQDHFDLALDMATKIQQLICLDCVALEEKEQRIDAFIDYVNAGRQPETQTFCEMLISALQTYKETCNNTVNKAMPSA